MIKIEKAKKRYTYGYFDLLTDGKDDYVDNHVMSPKEDNEFSFKNDVYTFGDTWTPISLSNVSKNPYEALKILDIDAVELKEASRYQCCYLEQTFYSVVPTWLITKNANKYAFFDKHYMRDMYSDQQWMMQTWNYYHKSLGRFEKVMLGPGYTDFFMTHDGSSDGYDALLKLSNGDFVMVAIWHWYNK